MHVQLVTFGLNGVSEDDYQEACRTQTGTFAALPGLLAKIWLRDPEKGVYGGIYLWRDREAFERYTGGEVFAAVAGDPALANVTSTDFGVFTELTKATQPEVLLV